MELYDILTYISLIYLNGGVLIQSYRLYQLKSSYEIALTSVIGLPIAETICLIAAISKGELVGTVGYGIGLLFHTIFTYTVVYYRLKNRKK